MSCMLQRAIANKCAETECANGGTCISQSHAAMCLCKPGFEVLKEMQSISTAKQGTHYEHTVHTERKARNFFIRNENKQVNNFVFFHFHSHFCPSRSLYSNLLIFVTENACERCEHR